MPFTVNLWTMSVHEVTIFVISTFIGICQSQRDHRFAPIVQRLLWLWRPIREWQSPPHLEHVKAEVGLLARHAVFLWSLFSSTFNRYVSSYCDNSRFIACLQTSLSMPVTSQESVFMPSAWRSRLHTSLKRSWGRPVGLSLSPVRHIKGLLECGHHSSVSHVPAITCTFA